MATLRWTQNTDEQGKTVDLHKADLAEEVQGECVGRGVVRVRVEQRPGHEPDGVQLLVLPLDALSNYRTRKQTVTTETQQQ